MKVVSGILSTVLAFVLASCIGGGVDSNAGKSEFSSDALVEALPYEVVRNNLIQAFGLSSSSPAIELLDTNAQTFGALQSNGGGRATSLTLSRMMVSNQVCALAAKEGLTNNPTDFFDGNSLDPSKAYRKITGRPITDDHRQAMDALVALDGYPGIAGKQYAIAYASCANFLNWIK